MPTYSPTTLLSMLGAYLLTYHTDINARCLPTYLLFETLLSSILGSKLAGSLILTNIGGSEKNVVYMKKKCMRSTILN